MARRSKKRTMSARIVLTAEAYGAIESAAFKNCRTVSQELSYRIERQIEQKHAITETPYIPPLACYDEPEPRQYVSAASRDAPGTPGMAKATLPPAGWTPEQESEIYVLGQAAGLGDAQVTALRLINKNYEAVKAAIESEKVAA